MRPGATPSRPISPNRNSLATMSHELRTPLNAIIGFSEVLKSELLGPHTVPQYKEYAGDIHSSGQHLLNLINELLDLSRIEAGKYELNEEAVSLIDIAEDCRRMVEIRAKAKGIELSFTYANNLPKLWGDERAIRQVVLNLLSNAIKFTPQSGKVALVVQRSNDGGQLISVRDNGPGIPEDEIETVLSSFGQGSLRRRRPNRAPASPADRAEDHGAASGPVRLVQQAALRPPR